MTGLDRAAAVAEGLPAAPGVPAGLPAASRLWAAVWALAARRGVALRPGSSLAQAARLLVGHGAIIPPAGDALVALDPALSDGDPVAAAVAGRLAGYLELRARYG